MTPLGSCMLPLLVLPLADASPPTRPSAVVLKESRGESGEWVLFDCTNKLCAYKMMHAECYARLVSWGGVSKAPYHARCHPSPPRPANPSHTASTQPCVVIRTQPQLIEPTQLRTLTTQLQP